MFQPRQVRPYDPNSEYNDIPWGQWQRLKQLAPSLSAMAKQSGQAPDLPVCLTEAMFIALVASFANPRRREILASLILDCIEEKLEADLGKAKEGGAD